MVKYLFISILLSLKIFSFDIYDKECAYCHKMLMVDLKDMYFKYLKRYSSEKSVKSVMMYYLKNPNRDMSVMPKEYIRLFDIKSKSKLSDEDLKIAIDIYWDRYKLKGKLK